MREKESGNKDGKDIMSTTGPDVCKTPMGSSMVPVAYTSIAFLDKSTRLSSSVRNNKTTDFQLNSRTTVSFGMEPGVGKGVVKPGYMGPCAIKKSSSTVFSEGYPVTRHKDKAVINMPNMGPKEYQKPKKKGP